MDTHSFKQWKDLSNRVTTNKGDHKLAEMTAVQFRRGSRFLYYKRSHDNTPFVVVDFLKKIEKADIGIIPERKAVPRGIPASKKEGIVKTLCPLMPRSRAVFWEDLPTNDDVGDLIDVY
ncbi:U-box domain-containing protein 16 [Elysia marginata]|uniref:U-box domain-containing protein 16 n=1 Tax=Elysia marginata TaxID=1093978 RepID=A0AAV4EF21_9GAST|nr:U-box domain-containing protein 16 [Elysia marginata]